MRTIVLTGCTAGLGLTLLNKLISKEPESKYVIICRNIKKAEIVFKNEIERMKKTEGSLTIVHGDNGDLRSIFDCCKTIRNSVSKIDAIFFNAGTMGKTSLDYFGGLKALLTPWSLPYKMVTGEGFLKFQQENSKDGFQTLFQSNALSHFIIVRELEDLLQNSVVIWTSSNTAQRENFNTSDIQGLNARDPYGSSKYLVNLISSYLQSSNIKSFVCDPGTFASNITLSLVPWFFEYPIKIFYRLLQPFTPKLTGNTDLATASLIHVFEKYSSLAVDNVKYESRVSFLGYPYTSASPIDVPTNFAENVWTELDKIYFDQKLRFQG